MAAENITDRANKDAQKAKQAAGDDLDENGKFWHDAQRNVLDKMPPWLPS